MRKCTYPKPRPVEAAILAHLFVPAGDGQSQQTRTLAWQRVACRHWDVLLVTAGASGPYEWAAHRLITDPEKPRRGALKRVASRLLNHATQLGDKGLFRFHWSALGAAGQALGDLGVPVEHCPMTIFKHGGHRRPAVVAVFQPGAHEPTCFVRVLAAAEGPNRLCSADAALGYLMACGNLAGEFPRPELFLSDGSVTVSIERAVPGGRTPGEDELAALLVQWLASVREACDRRLRLRNTQYIRQTTTTLMDHAETLPSAASRWLTLLEAGEWGEFEVGVGPVHGDVNRRNAWIRDDHLCLVDWELSTDGPLAADYIRFSLFGRPSRPVSPAALTASPHVLEHLSRIDCDVSASKVPALVASVLLRELALGLEDGYGIDHPRLRRIGHLLADPALQLF